MAAFRSGPRPLRAVAFLAAMLALIALGLALRSELAPRVLSHRAVGDVIRATQLALQPAAAAVERVAALEPPSSLPPIASAAELAAPPAAVEAVPERIQPEPPRPAHVQAAASPPSASQPASDVATGSRAAASGSSAPAPQFPALGIVAPAATATLAAGEANTASAPAPTREANAAAPVVPGSSVSEPAALDAPVSATVPEPAVPAPVAPATGAANAVDVEDPSARRFDPNAARAALQEAAERAQSCRPPAGPRGRGRVQVRFEPSGKVGAAWMMTPLFDNTVTGACVLMLFRRATVPEFDGGPEMVIKSFEVP